MRASKTMALYQAESKISSLESQLAAVTKERDAFVLERDEALNDLRFRRELYKLQAESREKVFADNALLLEDKARLEFLIRENLQVCDFGDSWVVRNSCGDVVTECHPTPRAAIDAARKEQP